MSYVMEFEDTSKIEKGDTELDFEGVRIQDSGFRIQGLGFRVQFGDTSKIEKGDTELEFEGWGFRA